MLNMTRINQAVMLAESVFEAENIMVTRDCLFKRAIAWYEHSDIVDVEILAAAVCYGDYSPSVSYSEILNLRDVLFKINESWIVDLNLAIGEIEAAQMDAMWRD